MDRQIDVLYYERLLSSKEPAPVQQEAKEQTDALRMAPKDYLRDPFDQHLKEPEDNPTIGLILCSEKSEAVAKYSVLTDNRQLVASKYLPFLPSEEELRQELERERKLLSVDE